MTLSPTLRRIGPAMLLFVVIAIVITACIPGSSPAGSGALPSASIHPPLTPAEPKDPLSLFSWIFTPIFQVMLIILIAVYQFLENLGVPGAIAWSIVVLTLIVRAILIPLYRKQLVSQRRMQLIQPELKEVQKRFKGDQVKARMAQQELFKERGINPLAGCLPLLLQLPLLFVMYQVISSGLTNQDPRAMLDGVRGPGRGRPVHQHRQRGAGRDQALHRRGRADPRQHRPCRRPSTRSRSSGSG